MGVSVAVLRIVFRMYLSCMTCKRSSYTLDLPTNRPVVSGRIQVERKRAISSAVK